MLFYFLEEGINGPKHVPTHTKRVFRCGERTWFAGNVDVREGRILQREPQRQPLLRLRAGRSYLGARQGRHPLHGKAGDGKQHR